MASCNASNWWIYLGGMLRGTHPVSSLMDDTLRVSVDLLSYPQVATGSRRRWHEESSRSVVSLPTLGVLESSHKSVQFNEMTPPCRNIDHLYMAKPPFTKVTSLHAFARRKNHGMNSNTKANNKKKKKQVSLKGYSSHCKYLFAIETSTPGGVAHSLERTC